MTKLGELMQIEEDRQYQSDFMVTDVYYCVGLKCEQKHDHSEYDLSKVKGKMTVSKNMLYFEPD